MSEAPAFDAFFKALKLYNMNETKESEEACTKILQRNPLDQAAWALKLACLTESLYTDELENNDVGIAETFLEQTRHIVCSTFDECQVRQSTPKADDKLRSTFVRRCEANDNCQTWHYGPSRSDKSNGQNSSSRYVQLSALRSAWNGANFQASMASNIDGPFVNLARLNVEKYAKDPQVNKSLFEYVFYHEGDIKIAHQIAAIATKEAEYSDWYWKNQLGKCYYRLSLFQDAEKQFLSSLKNAPNPETFAFLAKVYNRIDQPLLAIKYYEEGLSKFPNNVTLLTGLARTNEQLGKIDESIETYKEILVVQANNIEAIACIATNFFYNDLPEIALRYYRRILQMGVSNAEVFLNIGLCCFYCQQFDVAITFIERAHASATEDVQADIWYNTGQIALLAITADQDHGEALCNLAILHANEGRFEQARSLLLSAKAKAPHLFEPLFNLALLCHQFGRISEAMENVTAALKIFPEHAHALALKRQISTLYTMI